MHKCLIWRNLSKPSLQKQPPERKGLIPPPPPLAPSTVMPGVRETALSQALSTRKGSGEPRMDANERESGIASCPSCPSVESIHRGGGCTLFSCHSFETATGTNAGFRFGEFRGLPLFLLFFCWRGEKNFRQGKVFWRSARRRHVTKRPVAGRPMAISSGGKGAGVG